MSTASQALRITPACFQAMIRHAIDVAPEECCGFLAGDGWLAHRLLPLENELHSPVAYSASPQSLIRAFREIRRCGLELMAIYHSHPTSPAEPSQTDLAVNYYGDLPRPIISLTTDPPTVRCFVLGERSWVEIPIELVQPEPQRE